MDILPFSLVIVTIIGLTLGIKTTNDLPTTVATSYFNAELYSVADIDNFHPEQGSLNMLSTPEIGGTYWWAAHGVDGYDAVGVAFTNGYQDPNTGSITSESSLSSLVYKCWSHSSSQGNYHEPMFQVRGTDDPNVNVHIAYMINLNNPKQWKQIGIKSSKPAGASASDDQTSFVVKYKNFDDNDGDIYIATTDEGIAGCYGSAYIYNSNNGKRSNGIEVQIPNRPVAYGRFDADKNVGRVDFTDDQKYKMTFNPSTGVIDWDGLERKWSGDKRREWDGTNNWKKDIPDIDGIYNHIIDTDKNCDVEIYRTTGNLIEVDWSGCNNRPIATGYVNCPTGSDQPFMGEVTFPDDRTYRLAYFQDEGKIYWDGNNGPDDTHNVWVKDELSSSTTTKGYYYDFYNLWEIEEINYDEIINDMVEIGIIDNVLKSKINIFIIIIISVVLLYFGYTISSKRKDNVYQTLN